MEFAVFDSLLDTVWILDSEKKVVYCNETAASLVKSSQRRLLSQSLSEHIEFSDLNLFTNIVGGDVALPFTEMDFKLTKKEGVGKLQISVNPFEQDGQKLWIMIGHDTTLEETLHRKHHAQLAALEDYSRNLEKKVEERTLELRRANSMLEATMNSLGQGFLIFNAQGLCENVYTKACEDILECVPAGKSIEEVLKTSPEEKETFQLWIEAIFKGSLDFDSLKDLGPKSFPHSKQRNIRLDFFPIREEEVTVLVVMVATDETEQRAAQQALEIERAHARMILRAVRNKNRFGKFLQQVAETIHAEKTRKQMDVNESFRLLHTLEGEAGLFSIQEIRQAARASQEVLEPLRSGWAESTTDIAEKYMRSLLDFEKTLDDFSVHQTELLDALSIRTKETREVELAWAKNFGLKIKEASRELWQEYNHAVLHESLHQLLRPFSDLIETVAEKLGKQVNPLQIEGADIRLDTKLYQVAMDSLVHLFRNAVDHGLESPEDRELAGKGPKGTVRVRTNEVSHGTRTGFLLTIADDGRGVDIQKVREKLQNLFAERDWSKASDQEILMGLFLPGFSSRDEVGEYSGRGVGLDAVKTAIDDLDGELEVQSVFGKGTEFQIWLPFEVSKTVKAA